MSNCGTSKAPNGWVCTRDSGHTGPCAAVRDPLDEYCAYCARVKGSHFGPVEDPVCYKGNVFGSRFRGTGEFADPALTEGAELISIERERQMSEEGWTAEHDDLHSMGELALAAKTYILFAQDSICGRKRAVYPGWPWDYSWWKPSPDPIRNLVKAGALIAAEIDRLQRRKEN